MTKFKTVSEMTNVERRNVYRNNSIGSEVDPWTGKRRFYIIGFKTWVMKHLHFTPWQTYEC